MKNQKYKTSGNRGLFDEQETYQKLTSIGNPLEKINKVIDFEYFRNMLEEGVLNNDKKNKIQKHEEINIKPIILCNLPLNDSKY